MIKNSEFTETHFWVHFEDPAQKSMGTIERNNLNTLRGKFSEISRQFALIADELKWTHNLIFHPEYPTLESLFKVEGRKVVFLATQNREVFKIFDRSLGFFIFCDYKLNENSLEETLDTIQCKSIAEKVVKLASNQGYVSAKPGYEFSNKDMLDIISNLSYEKKLFNSFKSLPIFYKDGLDIVKNGYHQRSSFNFFDTTKTILWLESIGADRLIVETFQNCCYNGSNVMTFYQQGTFFLDDYYDIPKEFSYESFYLKIEEFWWSFNCFSTAKFLERKFDIKIKPFLGNKRFDRRLNGRALEKFGIELFWSHESSEKTLSNLSNLLKSNELNWNETQVSIAKILMESPALISFLYEDRLKRLDKSMTLQDTLALCGGKDPNSTLCILPKEIILKILALKHKI